MNRFIAAYSENGGAQNFLRFFIHHNFHKALRFAFFDRAAHFRHGAFADECAPACVANLRLGHTSAPQRGVDEKAVSRNAITHSPGIVIQQVRGYNFEIIIGRVSECAFAVAVAHGPNARDAGA